MQNSLILRKLLHFLNNYTKPKKIPLRNFVRLGILVQTLKLTKSNCVTDSSFFAKNTVKVLQWLIYYDTAWTCPPWISLLKPSVFWSICQGFPRWLSLLLVGLALIVPLLLWMANCPCAPMFLLQHQHQWLMPNQTTTDENLIVDVSHE